jgi:hypothetical protein
MRGHAAAFLIFVATECKGGSFFNIFFFFSNNPLRVLEFVAA